MNKGDGGRGREGGGVRLERTESYMTEIDEKEKRKKRILVEIDKGEEKEMLKREYDIENWE
jgi:hypothetical protein